METLNEIADILISYLLYPCLIKSRQVINPQTFFLLVEDCCRLVAASLTTCLYFIRRWKIHESVMLAMGGVRLMFVGAIKEGKVKFDFPDFLQNVLLADLSNPGE